MPTVNVDNTWIQTYEFNLKHALQQQESVFEGKVEKTAVTGERKGYSFIGEAEMIERLGKNQKTVWQDIEFRRRWIGRRTFDFNVKLDRGEDIEKALVDPTSDVFKASLMAAKRQKDKIIMGAFYDPVYTGKDGLTAVNFPAGNVIDVTTGSADSSNTHLNLAKLKELAARMGDAHLPENDPRYIAVTERQIQWLMDDDHATSADYAAIKALQQGTINTFMGFTFVRYTGLREANNVIDCLAWSKSCVLFGVARDIATHGPTELPEFNWDPGLGVTLVADATRLYDEGVFQVPCKNN